MNDLEIELDNFMNIPLESTDRMCRTRYYRGNLKQVCTYVNLYLLAINWRPLFYKSTNNLQGVGAENGPDKTSKNKNSMNQNQNGTDTCYTSSVPEQRYTS